jgi:hypothetical protein
MQEYFEMNKLAVAVSTTALLLGSVALGVAQDRDRGASESGPGQQMQEKGSVPGHPGASGYAPAMIVMISARGCSVIAMIAAPWIAIGNRK